MTISIALACLGLTSCEFFEDPCGDRFLAGHVGMQGIWRVTEIDGEAITPNGNKLTGSDDYMVVGSIEFEETSVDGTCDKPTVSRGTIIVRVILGDGAGHNKPGEAYPGEYTLNHKTNAITMRALNKDARGTRSEDHDNASVEVLDPLVSVLTLATMTITRESTDNISRKGAPR